MSDTTPENSTVEDRTDHLTSGDVFEQLRTGDEVLWDGKTKPLTVTVGYHEANQQTDGEPWSLFVEGPRGGEKMLTRAQDGDTVRVSSLSLGSKGSERVENLRIVTDDDQRDAGDSDDSDATDDGADDSERTTAEPNEPVLVIMGTTRVMHTPRVVEGEASTTGKTIAVEDPHQSDRTYRLDADTILSGGREYRRATYFELYTPERLQRRQESNRAPGPRAGVNKVTDREAMPEPTHTLPGSDESAASEVAGDE